MKKIITLCFMLVISSVAMSQSKSSVAETNATKMTNDWASRLSLTAEQKTKSYDILLAKMQARILVMEAFKKDGNEANKTAALAKIREELKKEMNPVIKDGQKYQQWLTLLEKDGSTR